MCFLPKQQTVQAPVAETAPQKTDAQIQSEAEKERQQRAYSTRGIAATILTSGLGDTTAAPTRGVTLSGF